MCFHPPCFIIRAFTHRVKRFRVITHQALISCFYTPSNVFLHTIYRVITHQTLDFSILFQWLMEPHPQRNTYINTYLTHTGLWITLISCFQLRCRSDYGAAAHGASRARAARAQSHTEKAVPSSMASSHPLRQARREGYRCIKTGKGKHADHASCFWRA